MCGEGQAERVLQACIMEVASCLAQAGHTGQGAEAHDVYEVRCLEMTDPGLICEETASGYPHFPRDIGMQVLPEYQGSEVLGP